ncbi:MAG TPA: adenosylhomocysteinase [Clostridiales bacterium]|nr:adenosylhomocysteinase [Clostridiales bacterium]
MSIIKNPELYPLGLQKIEWVKRFMPVLNELERRYSDKKPLKGLRVSLCIHLEAKTAYLALLLRELGADVRATGSNPLSTKDEICAALNHLGIEVFAIHGATDEEYFEHIRKTLEFRPHIIIDDGGDFVEMLTNEPELAENLIGGCEETTTGIHRLRMRERNGTLNFPMIAVNDANCKHLFDNVHGTGQSVWDAIMFTTNNMVSGKTVVVAGYGFCSKGIANRAKGLGANVIVTEVNPYRALEAAMDGFRVMKMIDAAPLGDIFITATGCNDVINKQHYELMKDDCMIANAGHFDVEVNKVDLRALSVKYEESKPFIETYTLSTGKRINLLADGRLVNIVAGNGHPAEIMDLSFAIQTLCVLHLAKNGTKLENRLYDVPDEIDHDVAMIKLKAMGLGLDELTGEQKEYMGI